LILVWLPKALLSRFEQLDYIAQDNPLATADQDEEIEHPVNLLLQNPKMGRPGRMQWTRHIEILRLLHGSQQ
jgi:toxin ParE1/3/4